MKWCLLSILLSFFALGCFALDPILSTGLGEIEGRLNEAAGTVEFLGIPYASQDRFQPPTDLTSLPLTENGTPFQAVSFGPCCPQRYSYTYIPEPTSEDCLSLNIFAPQSVLTSTEKLPVMVWVYGGGGTFGCSAQSNPLLYDGSSLISNAPSGVIVVTINYRLDVLASLYHTKLNQENPDFPSSGNYGYLDVLSSLRWIQRHISDFGGDKDRVTVFGESAGGNTCIDILAARGASGLVHKIIAESSTSFNFASFINKEKANQLSAHVLKATGCDQELDEIACLRALNVMDLLNKAEETSNDYGISTVDGYLFKDYPYFMALRGELVKVDAVVGRNDPDAWPLCAQYPDVTCEISIGYIQSEDWGMSEEQMSKAIKAYGIDTCLPPDCCRRVEEYVCGCEEASH